MTLESVRQDFEELDRALGVKSPMAFQPLAELHASRDYTGLCRAIGVHMGLPNAVRLVTTSERQRFTTRALSTTDAEGRGTHGIVAQINIPSYLPMYGTAAFAAHVVDLLLGKEFATATPYTAVALLAHELSHVLIYALKHPKRESEPFTDLVPIVLGFGHIVERGRVVSTSETRGNTEYTSKVTYGYLSDDEFECARRLTHTRLEVRIEKRNETHVLATRVHRRAKEAIASTRHLAAALSQMDAEPHKVRRRDGPRVVELHRPGYFDDQERTLSIMARTAGDTATFAGGLSHFPQPLVEKLATMHSHCVRVAAQLAVIDKRLRADLRVVGRHRRLAHRLQHLGRQIVVFVRRHLRLPSRTAA
jgi:hypothetical protein